MKKWLSKALVLAMVVAMMIPVPVAAKSSNGGGALVKSIEVYNFNTSTQGWDLEQKVSYSYDKKGYPAEITTRNIYATVMGIPVSASADISTFKYKFNGKTPKSLKIENTAGAVVDARKYKKGKVASANETTIYDWLDPVEMSNSSAAYAYDKKGNIKAATFVEGSSIANAGFVVKKNLTAYNIIENDGTSYQGYVAYNKKGLAVESGALNAAGQPVATSRVVYTMKKGKVATAAVYTVHEDGTQTPSSVIKFKYTKNKISKNRYANMINDTVFPWSAVPNFWY